MLYATKNCHAGFWRTLPDIVLDEDHPEDVDTTQEDHCYDDVRYGCVSRPWAQAIKRKEEKVDRWLNFEVKEEESWRTA
jgi:hypothetical protein